MPSAGHGGIFVGTLHVALLFCHPPTTYTHPSKTSEIDPLTPLPLWWTAALTGILVIAVFGVVTIKFYPDSRSKDRILEPGKSDVADLITNSRVDSAKIKRVHKADPRGYVTCKPDLSDGTFSLDDDGIYYLFLDSKSKLFDFSEFFVF